MRLRQHRILALGLLAVALAGCRTDATAPAPLVTRVRVVQVAPQTYAPPTELTGEIAAQVSGDLSFRVGGRMIERLVDVGDHIVAGQALARLDPVSQTADLDAAKAALTSAEAQAKQASAAFDRQKELLAKGFSTQRSYDQAEQAMRVANASVDTARAQVGTATDALGYSELKAGNPGIITARRADVGEVVQAAQTVFTVAEDGPRDAVFEVNEAVVTGRAKPPQVTVALVSHPDVTATGTVRQVSPSIDPRTGTVKVKIELKSTPDAMTLGSPVAGSASIPGRPGIALPWTAMASLDGKPAVWVYDANAHTVSLRAVTLLAHETSRFIVGDGLAAGDQVVTEGTKLLRPGETVTPIGEAS